MMPSQQRPRPLRTPVATFRFGASALPPVQFTESFLPGDHCICLGKVFAGGSVTIDGHDCVSGASYIKAFLVTPDQAIATAAAARPARATFADVGAGLLQAGCTMCLMYCPGYLDLARRYVAQDKVHQLESIKNLLETCIKWINKGAPLKVCAFPLASPPRLVPVYRRVPTGPILDILGEMKSLIETLPEPSRSRLQEKLAQAYAVLNL